VVDIPPFSPLFVSKDEGGAGAVYCYGFVGRLVCLGILAWACRIDR
jgi:hypothetical protein